MAGETTATTPAVPAFDYDQLAAAMTKANAPLLAQLEKLSTPAPAAAAAATAANAASTAAAPLTAAEVKNLLAEGLKAFSQSQQANSTREAFVQKNMADLPAAYRSQLPQTGDLAELAKAEQSLRAQYQADFKLAGGTTGVVGGAAGAGTGAGGAQAASAAIDTSKMDSVSKIAMGLKAEGAPPRVGAPNNGTGAAAAGAVAAAAGQS